MTYARCCSTSSPPPCGWQVDMSGRVGPGVLRERGMVTAEVAVCLTGLVTVALGLLWVIAVVAQQVRCQDAARDAARAVSRGEDEATSRAEGLRTAPEGSKIAIRVADGLATVTVEVDARPPWPVLARLPPVPVRARAVVAVEPGVGGPAATSPFRRAPTDNRR